MTQNIRFLLVEGISIGTCVLAATIGPGLLINARYSFGFTSAGFAFSIISAFIYGIIGLLHGKLIDSILHDKGKMVLGILVGFIPFFGFIIVRNLNHLSSLLWLHWTSGFSNFPIVVGMVLIQILFHVFYGKGIYRAVHLVGVYMLFPMFLILLAIPTIPNSEGKVLLFSVSILYFFVRLLMGKLLKVE